MSLASELRLFLAIAVVVCTGIGVGVILDHYGTPTVVYVHTYAPQCPSPLPSPVQRVSAPSRADAGSSARVDPPSEVGSPALHRLEQIFVDSLAHEAMQVLERAIFLGTDDGFAALSLARSASFRCRFLAYDEVEQRLEAVIKEWSMLDLPAEAIIRRIRGEEAVFAEELLLVDDRAPMLVVVNWSEQGKLLASGVLQEMAPLLPDNSVLVVRDEAWDLYSSGRLEVVVQTANGGSAKLFIDEGLQRPADEMGVGLVAVRVEQSLQVPGFERSLLPRWTGLGQVQLQTPKQPEKGAWFVFARLQKTASKTVEGFLLSHSQSSRCGRRFLTSPPYNNRYCASNELCSIENVLGVMESQEGYCNLLSGHHCDWDDLMEGVSNYGADKIYSLTGVREPAHRVRSEFKHVHGSHLKAWDYCPSAEGRPEEKFAKETFVSFLNSEENEWGMRNRQTRMLAGCGTREPCTLTSDQLLEKAKQHVLRLDAVTMAERLSESVLVLAYTFGWNINEFATVSDSRAVADTVDWELDDELIAVVMEKNFLDAELVRFCDHIMNARVAQFKERVALAEELPELECEDGMCRLSNAAAIDWGAFVL